MFENYTKAALLAVSAFAQLEYPGDNCCTFYSDWGYEGDSWKICNGSTSSSETYIADDYGFGDRMSSYQCGANTSFDLCSDRDGSCDHSDRLVGGAGNVMTAKTGNNDMVDRVILKHYDPTEQGAITAFQDDNCENHAGRFDADSDPTRPARYTLSMMEDRGLWNDCISSIMIPYGYSVTLYGDEGFEGDQTTLTGPMWKSKDHFRLQCLDMPDNWHDRVSSLIVYRNNAGGKARGRWIGVTSTESVKFTYNVGFSSTKSQEEQETEEWSLSYQMTTGIEFMGEKESETLSAGYSGSVMTDAKTSMTKDISLNWHIQCTGSQGASGGVGLWQFAVYTDDEESWTLTTHTVCRYGSLYNHAPDCPWNACTNGDCSSCASGWH